MALAAAGRAEEQDIGAFLQPGIAGCQRHHLRFRDHWHDLEVEGGERLAGGQSRLGEMPLEAAAATVGHLVLGEYVVAAECYKRHLDLRYGCRVWSEPLTQECQIW